MDMRASCLHVHKVIFLSVEIMYILSSKKSNRLQKNEKCFRPKIVTKKIATIRFWVTL